MGGVSRGADHGRGPGRSQRRRLGAESDARAIEAALKSDLAEFRTDSPGWVPTEARGHTEWFGAVHFGRAEERLRSFIDEIEHSGVHSASDYIRLGSNV